MLRIKYLRQRRGISQRELAERIGTTRASVGSWEIERVMPDHAKLIAMADFFNVSVDYLIGRNTTPALLGFANLENLRISRDYNRGELRFVSLYNELDADARAFFQSILDRECRQPDVCLRLQKSLDVR